MSIRRGLPSRIRRGLRAALALQLVLAGVAVHPLLARTTDATGEGEAITRTLDVTMLPDQVPEVQRVEFKTLDKDVMVQGSSLTDKDLRRKLRKLRLAVSAFEDAGYHIGIVLRDLGTGASLSYGSDEAFYPASSVKGPYVVAAYEAVESGELKVGIDTVSRLAAPTIIYSDNDTYRTLHGLCGGKVFAEWAVACGAVRRQTDQYEEFIWNNYPSLTSEQLALMWEQTFAYLEGGSDGAHELLGFFEQREVSPLRDGIPSAELTIAKAGWYYPEGYGDPSSTVDAGIVMQGGHGYVMVVMTDAPGDLDRLAELVPDIFTGRKVLR